jgi:hypothetical protein
MLAAVVVVAGAVGAGALALTGGSSTPVTATTTSTTGFTTTTTRAVTTTTRPPTTTSSTVSEPIPPLGRLIVSDTFDSSSMFEVAGQVEGFGTWVWDVRGGSLFLQAEPVGEFSVSSTRPFQLPDSYIVSAPLTGPNCGIRLADGDAEALFLIVEENIEFRVQVIGDLDTRTLENGFFGAINPEGGNVLTVYVDGSRALAFINGVEVADVSNPFFLRVLSAGPAARVSRYERSCEVFEFSIHESGV